MGISKSGRVQGSALSCQGRIMRGEMTIFWGLFPISSRVEAPVKWLWQEASGIVSPDVTALVNWT